MSVRLSHRPWKEKMGLSLNIDFVYMQVLRSNPILHNSDLRVYISMYKLLLIELM